MNFLQMAGMLVWPSFASTELSEEEKTALREVRPSGVILFRRNMKSLVQTQRLVAEIRELVNADQREFEFVVAIDEEGARVSRLPAPFVRGQSPRSFGDARDWEGLGSQVLFQASTAAGVGINTILAPVADILTKPNNPAIGDRAFGTDADIVGECVLLVYETLKKNGIRSCVKHFPGHGNTLTDTHLGFATTDASLVTLQTREWVPFQKVFERGMQMCMTGHVIATALDPHRPATLSPIVLQSYLREQLHFQGLIISDDLRMNAVSDYYQVQRAVVASASIDILQNQTDNDSYLNLASVDALSAGCDVLLSCQSILSEMKVFNAIADKIKNDANFEKLCTEKIQRVVRVLNK